MICNMERNLTNWCTSHLFSILAWMDTKNMTFYPTRWSPSKREQSVILARNSTLDWSVFTVFRWGKPFDRRRLEHPLWIEENPSSLFVILIGLPLSDQIAAFAVSSICSGITIAKPYFGPEQMKKSDSFLSNSHCVLPEASNYDQAPFFLHHSNPILLGLDERHSVQSSCPNW